MIQYKIKVTFLQSLYLFLLPVFAVSGGADEVSHLLPVSCASLK